MFLNEDFIDAIDNKEDVIVQSSPDNSTSISDVYKISFGFMMLEFMHDVINRHINKDRYATEGKNQPYNVWKKYKEIKRFLDNLTFIKTYELETKIWVYYRHNGVDEREYGTEIFPTPSKQQMWDYIDAESIRESLGDFTTSLGFTASFVPNGIPYKKFIKELYTMVDFSNRMLTSMGNYGSHEMLFKTQAGWYQIKHLNHNNTLFSKMYNDLFPGTDESATPDDALYNQTIFENILIEFTKEHSDLVKLWKLNKCFYDPTKYPNKTFVTLYQADILEIVLDCKVPDDDNDKYPHERFYTKMLNAVKEDIFEKIPNVIRHFLKVCVIIRPSAKYTIDAPTKKDARRPDRGIGDGYEFVFNHYGIGSSHIKAFLRYEDQQVHDSQCCVMFMKHNKPNELNFNGHIQYPPAYKWAQMIQPEK